MASRVVSYMTRDVYTVSPDDTLAHARKLMLTHDISRLPVVEGSKLRGIITITDIADALVRKYPSRPANSIYVREVMARDVVTIEGTKSVKTAASLMLKHNIGGLPVVAPDGTLEGIITRTDLTRYYSEKMKGVNLVKEFMREIYAKARREHSIFYVLKLMEIDATGKVLILDGGKLVGVITKRDIAFLATPVSVHGAPKYVKIKKPLVYKDRIGSTRVYLVPLAEDVMTPNPITVEPEEDLAKAADIMVKEGVGILPVVDGDKVLGVVTKVEVLQAIVSSRRARRRL
ncbi:conserved hypothetical protein [Aeropyrum pernix]|uniref:CBS domain-containing protein n=1 Tax=Aeropyrum pernix TaxID=56636 RepID=A0A401HB43_AERPX|nr:CBS domain-containing protein [Aeropyrum pernix]GBF09666.1 conserved hypothetical protein [Aeropyrum pernix]